MKFKQCLVTVQRLTIKGCHGDANRHGNYAHAHHNAVVGLMAATGKEPFYEKYGFTRRPTNTLGAGMTIFYKKNV